MFICEYGNHSSWKLKTRSNSALTNLMLNLESSTTPSNHPTTESDDSESCNRLAIVEEEDIEVIENNEQPPAGTIDKPLFTPYSTGASQVPSAPMLSAQQLNTLRQFNQNHNLLQGTVIIVYANSCNMQHYSIKLITFAIHWEVIVEV